MGFDPKAFLDEPDTTPTAPAFDPQSFLAETEPKPVELAYQPKPGDIPINMPKQPEGVYGEDIARFEQQKAQNPDILKQKQDFTKPIMAGALNTAGFAAEMVTKIPKWFKGFEDKGRDEQLKKLDEWEKKGVNPEFIAKQREKIQKEKDDLQAIGEAVKPVVKAVEPLTKAVKQKTFEWSETISPIADEAAALREELADIGAGKDRFIDDMVDSYKKGTLDTKLNWFGTQALLRGDTKSAELSKQLAEEYHQAQLEDWQKQQQDPNFVGPVKPVSPGKFREITRSVARMAPGLVTSMAVSAVPILGAPAAFAGWASQGAGQVYQDAVAQGADPEKARVSAAIAGPIYAAVEQLQIGQISKNPVIKSKILHFFKEYGIDVAKEVNEEGLQGVVTTIATEKAKGNDDVNDIAKKAWESYLENAKSSITSLAVVTGATRGAHVAIGAMAGKPPTTVTEKPGVDITAGGQPGQQEELKGQTPGDIHLRNSEGKNLLASGQEILKGISEEDQGAILRKVQDEKQAKEEQQGIVSGLSDEDARQIIAKARIPGIDATKATADDLARVKESADKVLSEKKPTGEGSIYNMVQPAPADQEAGKTIAERHGLKFVDATEGPRDQGGVKLNFQDEVTGKTISAPAGSAESEVIKVLDATRQSNPKEYGKSIAEKAGVEFIGHKEELTKATGKGTYESEMRASFKTPLGNQITVPFSATVDEIKTRAADMDKQVGAKNEESQKTETLLKPQESAPLPIARSTRDTDRMLKMYVDSGKTETSIAKETHANLLSVLDQVHARDIVDAIGLTEEQAIQGIQDIKDLKDSDPAKKIRNILASSLFYGESVDEQVASLAQPRDADTRVTDPETVKKLVEYDPDVEGDRAKTVQKFSEDNGLAFSKKEQTSFNIPPKQISDYITWSDIHKSILSNYFDSEGNQIAVSNEVPAKQIDLPIGKWRIDDMAGIHGHEIQQLQMVDPNDLIDVEEPEKYRRGDVDKYEQWRKDGLVPPPIDVVKQTNGKRGLKIVDGHRRAAAAKRLGLKIPAWVSPIAQHPEGLTDGITGEVQMVGMTFEMLKNQEPQFNKGRAAGSLTLDALKEKVQGELPRVMRMLPKDFKGKVNVSISKEFIYKGRKFGGDDWEAAVWYDPKGKVVEVHINPNISESRLALALMHELPGHIGSRLVYADNMPIYNRMKSFFDKMNAENDPTIARIKRDYKDEMRNDVNNEKLFDEWTAAQLADYIEKGKRTSVTTRVYNFFRELLTKLGVLPKDLNSTMREMIKLMRKGSYERLDGNQAFQMERRQEDMFYSPTLKAAQGLKQEKGTGEQMFAMITKTPGVKEAEWKWMGLDDFLKGKKSVTKKEIEDFVKQNQIEIQEVRKGIPESNENEFYSNSERWGNEPAEFKTLEEAENTAMRIWNMPPDEARAFVDETNEISRHRKSLRGDTKFSQYTLPGGENYREMLLTLPITKYETGKNWIMYDKNDKIIGRPLGGNTVDKAINQFNIYYGKERGEAVRAEREISKFEKPDFTSSHWDEPNVIAHIRMNDRTGPDGEKILFVEEIQSDWAREAREKGVSDPSKKNLGIRKIEDGYEVYDKTTGRIISVSIDEETAQKSLVRSLEFSKTLPGVPNSPFLKNWEELTLKRILRMAAEEGYDRVAWINGEQTADRYDLSKSISKVIYQPQNKLLLAYNTDGGEVLIEKNIQPEKIADYIGKEPARRLRESPITGTGDNIGGMKEQTLKGIDLKIGGEWATNLYDKTIPKFLEKYGKRWNTKVEKIDLGINSNIDTGEQIDEGQQSIAITPEMRESVLYEGQPMFQKMTFSKAPREEEPAYKITDRRSYIPKITENDLPEIYEEAKTFDPEKSRKTIAKEYKSKRAGVGLAKYALRTVSGRLLEISPIILDKLQKHINKIHIDTANYMRQSIPLLEAMKKLPEADYRVFDIASKNSDVAEMDAIAEKHGFVPALEKYRDMMNSIIARAKDAGYETGYLENYFPRIPKDRNQYYKFIRKTPEWGQIQEALQQKAKDVGRDLAPEEQDEYINQYLRGYAGKNILGKPGNLKERKMKFIDNEMNSLLEDSILAIPMYIERMAKKIGRKELFGNINTSDDMIVDNLDESIGEYVGNLIRDYKLNPEKQDELIGLLKSYFNFKPTEKTMAAIKNISYATSMGSGFSSMFSQMQDMAFGFLTAPQHEAGAVLKALMGKTDITVKDLGIQDLGAEFRDPGKLFAAVDKLLTVVGLKWGDITFKNAFIQANLQKFRQMARTGKYSPQFRNELNNIFEERADELIEDLKNKRDTDLVKLLVMNQMSKYQPITQLQVPQAYLDAPRMRITYALKTYQINQVNAIIDEGIRAMQNAKSGDEWKKAFVRVVSMMAVLMAAGVGMDALKDLLFRRKANFGDYVLDNLLKLAMISRYTAWQARTNGWKSTLLSLLAPPLNWLDYAGRDIRRAQGEDFKLKNLESLRMLPVIGQEYYWWYGGGAEQTAKRAEKNLPPVKFERDMRKLKSEARRAARRGDDFEAAKKTQEMKELAEKSKPVIEEYYKKETEKPYPKKFQMISEFQNSKVPKLKLKGKELWDDLTPGQKALYSKFKQENSEKR